METRHDRPAPMPASRSDKHAEVLQAYTNRLIYLLSSDEAPKEHVEEAVSAAEPAGLVAYP